MTRKDNFAVGEYYHCYNRGVDKRIVFNDAQDFDYFLTALELFNREESLGGMMEYRYPKNINILKDGKETKLANIFAFCLNPNHFHLVLQPNFDNGVQKLMQKIGTGYTLYFNKKYSRSGSLFQGRYKSAHVDTDQFLKHVLSYVSLNNEVHSGISQSKYRSNLHINSQYDKAWDDTLLIQLFGSLREFERFAKDKLPSILERKEKLRELKEDWYID
jgi:REP element-mobilizing transposase RayT